MNTKTRMVILRPDLLRGLEGRLLTEVAAIDQQEVSWHVAQLLPRLALTPQQRTRACDAQPRP